MYEVKLVDGTIIEAELNGNNFIPEVLDRNAFIGNLGKVIVMDTDGNVEERLNQKVQFSKIGDIETFILLDKSKDDIIDEYLLDNDFRLSLLELGV